MASKLEITRSSGHVFADMGFPPGEAQSLLLRGKIEKFSLDALVNRLASAGMRVELKVSKPPARQAA